MSVASILARGRARHRILFLDEIRIEDPGAPVTAADGTTSRVPVVLYEGVARVKPVTVGDEEPEAGGRELVLRGYDVQLPYDAAPTGPVNVGHTVIVTAAGDPRLAGRRLVVTGEAYSSTHTCWHIPAETQT